MRYRFFTLQQAEDALRRAANNNAMQFDTAFQPLRLERMVLEDAGGNTSDKSLSDMFHLLYASEHRAIAAGQYPCIRAANTEETAWIYGITASLRR